MKYPSGYYWWVVVDPTKESEIEDICFQARVGDLALMARGGMDIPENNCTLYTDEVDAKSDALSRLNRRFS